MSDEMHVVAGSGQQRTEEGADASSAVNENAWATYSVGRHLAGSAPDLPVCRYGPARRFRAAGGQSSAATPRPPNRSLKTCSSHRSNNRNGS